MAPKMAQHLQRWMEQAGACLGIPHIRPPLKPEVDTSNRHTLFGNDVGRGKFLRCFRLTDVFT
jgi:hypothetical protein